MSPGAPRLACLALALLAAAMPASADERTAADVAACVAENLPDRSSVQSVLFRSTDRVGEASESRATVYWQRGEDGLSSVMMRFASPTDLRGAGLLLLEKEEGRSDMFMYLPEIGKVRRVTSRMMATSMFGTDFSYEEFERFQGFERGWTNTRLPDATVGDEAVYVIESRPQGPEDGSAYERILQYVHQEICLPLKTEFYERGGQLRKVAVTDRASIAKQKSGWLPRAVTIRDLRDETETDLVVEKLEIDEKIPRKFFSQRELESAGR
jgi:hypothetical protein